jgi:hypothetical protein
MPYAVTSCFGQVIDHWQTLIAGGVAGLAGLAAYIGALQAAGRQVKAANAQTAAVETQNAALKRADQQRLAREQLMVARLLDASLQLLKKDIDDASDSYKSPRENDIIAAGDANAIRDRIKKPASFPILMENITALSPDIAVLFLSLNAKIDRVKAETESITVGGLMNDRIGSLAETELALRNLTTEAIKSAESVLLDDDTPQR